MENPREEIYLETAERMEKAVEILAGDLRGIRTGRASPALVEGIRVDYYGAPTPLHQIASVSIPEPRLIVIKPYDPSALKEIEKSILKSELGVTPANDGKLLRLALPPLSEEQRKKLAARCKEIAEQVRVSLRNVRREGLKRVDAAEKDRALTEDDAKGLRDEIQELIKEHEAKVEEVLSRKTKEILEV
ncbi:MAG TPA: ribosome recycling factor [Planctomycetota bacterium]|nr:ribosome recycling factor [Planctomycetota bacterium]